MDNVLSDLLYGEIFSNGIFSDLNNILENTLGKAPPINVPHVINIPADAIDDGVDDVDDDIDDGEQIVLNEEQEKAMLSIKKFITTDTKSIKKTYRLSAVENLFSVGPDEEPDGPTPIEEPDGPPEPKPVYNAVITMGVEDMVLDDILAQANFMLLGPAGTGKTTIITNAFKDSGLKIAFCAYTNKATQVLKNMKKRFDKKSIDLSVSTIHKLLGLKPTTYMGDLVFVYDDETAAKIRDYDVIIFDECSTIDSQLYTYIKDTQSFIYTKYDKLMKFMFIGDFWQLPPVKENSSIVFDEAVKYKWKVARLKKIMRSNNDKILSINNILLSFIKNFKKNNKKIKSIVRKFPMNIIPDRTIYTSSMRDIYNKYMNYIDTDPSVVILSYSLANCQKINYAIQDILDDKYDRPKDIQRKKLVFYPNDRCCVSRPTQTVFTEQSINPVNSVIVRESVETLYNGEIFEVKSCSNVSVVTIINKFAFLPDSFPAQLVNVSRVSDNKILTTVNIDKKLLDRAKYRIKRTVSKEQYDDIIQHMDKLYPVMSYGYCISVYKSQGSEWNNVLINLCSIRFCVIYSDLKESEIDLDTRKKLFKTMYTACTRASKNLHLFWYDPN